MAQQSMTLDELCSKMKGEIRTLASTKQCYQEFKAFKERRKLSHLTYYQYLKSKVAFECTRDSGLWHIGYRITDRNPDSKNIWSQWKSARGRPSAVTAYAECDEISALYAFLARKLGVGGIGLFWPTDNHTVAVWKVEGQRIVVPTTPIFLDREDRFDARGFDPQSQAVIYDYTASDVPGDFRIPKALGNFFVSQVRNYGGASEPVLHELRYAREQVQLGGRPDLGRMKRLARSRADREAVRTFSSQFGIRLEGLH